MNKIFLSTRRQWRQWLEANHAREIGGVWLVFRKNREGRATALSYEEAVEEALCFGWIDSILKRIDEDKYCRKFTPRKDKSKWSTSNKQRVAMLIEAGRMTKFGLVKIAAAKASGAWMIDPRPQITLETPPDLSAALKRNHTAKTFFESLAPSYRKQFIGWIVTAKQPATRAERLKTSLALLSRNQKLGLK